MVQLLARAFAAVGAAFALGLVVGWLFWRFRRRSVSREQWAATRELIESLERRVDSVGAERDDLAGQVRALGFEAARLQVALAASWQERDDLYAQLVAFDAELDGFRGELERALAQRRHLQRRVAELSLTVARRSQPVVPLDPPVATRPGDVAASPGGPVAVPPPLDASRPDPDQVAR